MTPQLPPDYEARYVVAYELCQHLGIDPTQVELGSLTIELGTDHRHIVHWTGRARLNLDDLTGILIRAAEIRAQLT